LYLPEAAPAGRRLAGSGARPGFVDRTEYEGSAMSASTDDPRLQQARAVLRVHRDRLLREHAATGIGVGLDDGREPAIVVHLPPGRPLPTRSVVDGVPLIFKTMPPLKPM
jgi:hypothetical protein